MPGSVIRRGPLAQVSNQTLSVMLSNDALAASSLDDELLQTRQLLEGEGDIESSRFLKVLQVRSAVLQKE